MQGKDSGQMRETKRWKHLDMLRHAEVTVGQKEEVDVQLISNRWWYIRGTKSQTIERNLKQKWKQWNQRGYFLGRILLYQFWEMYVCMSDFRSCNLWKSTGQLKSCENVWLLTSSGKNPTLRRTPSLILKQGRAYDRSQC